ncbi:hypothetical protein VTI74DRAFT_4541 [Chaetomium olivicolor]
MTEAKMAIWELANPLQPGSLFRSMAKELREMYTPLHPAPIEGAPLALLNLCHLGPSSSAADNPYYTAVKILAPLLHIKAAKAPLAKLLSFENDSRHQPPANAGGLPTPGPIAGYDGDKFIRSITEGFLSLFNAFQAFKEHAAPGAVLLNTSSCMANVSPTPGMSAYSVSKAAALKLANVVATENPGLHVVSVQPGWVATDLNGHQKEATDTEVNVPGLLG